MTVIYKGEVHKYEIDGNMVTFYELMGGRWVSFFGAEMWCDEDIAELLED